MPIYKKSKFKLRGDRVFS